MKKTMDLADFYFSKNGGAVTVTAAWNGNKSTGKISTSVGALEKDFDLEFNLLICAMSYKVLRRAMAKSEEEALMRVLKAAINRE